MELQIQQNESKSEKLYLSFDIGIVNMAYCCMTESKKIIYWNVFSLCNDNEIENSKDLVKKLDEHPYLMDVDCILIEKQPKVNPKMRGMAEALKMYFIVRSVDKGKNYKIVDYSPKFKLKCYDGVTPEFKVKSEYSKRKKTSVFHTIQLLVNQPEEMKQLFEKAQSKKDDLADCFLQVLSFLMFNDTKKSEVIIQRAPTAKQLKYKKFTKHHIRYLFVQEVNKVIQNNSGFIDMESYNKNKSDSDIVLDIYQFFDKWRTSELVKKNITFLYRFDQSTMYKELIPVELEKCVFKKEFEQKTFRRKQKKSDVDSSTLIHGHSGDS